MWPRLHRLVACFAVASALLSVPVLAADGPLPVQARELFLAPDFEVSPSVPTPQSVLGYALGSRFTPHHRVLDYLELLAETSDRVAIWTYGETHEGRPLRMIAVSSPQNLARLEEIRQGQLALASGRLEAETLNDLLADAPVVAWLAYGVHGNESSSTEVAVAVAYALAAGEGDWAEALTQLVVLIDPLVNPDGRERYVQGYQQRRGREADPWRAGIEHREPWPGGRTNHYLNDLNRDWAWATQPETQARLRQYRRWEPQVYVDFHEMGSDSTYFFPPAAEPILPVIDARTVRWLQVFGEANGAAFDRQGWAFYKGENFDLFYPGYGDTYPALRAAVGMTYEVAGGGLAGQAIELRSGHELTLTDRIARHFTTSLTTLQVAAAHRRGLLEDYGAIRQRFRSQPTTTFLWLTGSGESSAMADLLDLHGIEVGRLAADFDIDARGTTDPELVRRRFPAGSYAVSTAQPLGSLARTLLETEARLSASFVEKQRERLERYQPTEFYDITAWALPLAFAVETWSVDGDLPVSSRPGEAMSPDAGAIAGPIAGPIAGAGRLGLLIPPQGLAGYRLCGRLQGAGLFYRVALEPFQLGGETYGAGTIYVPAGNNPADSLPGLESWIGELGLEARRAASSITSGGISLGSDRFVAIRAPRVALLAGAGLDAGSHGDLWFLLDQVLEIPHHRLDLDRLSYRDLVEIDVLILPSGSSYEAFLGGEPAKIDLGRWMEDGGLLIATGDALPWLQTKSLSAIASWEAPKDAAEASEVEEAKDSAQAAAENPLQGRKISTPGAALATVMSPGHPLTVGLERPPAVLTLGEAVYRPFQDPRRDVLTATPKEPLLAGFAWPEASERLAGSLLVSFEAKGDGGLVLFAQEPAFRSFWRATMPLVLNAILHGPSFRDAGFLE